MTTRKARETRAAYRVKSKARGAPLRARKPHAREMAERVVPWEERIAPTDEQLGEWMAWLNEHEPEFEQKYSGHYLAIWDKQIIAATRDSNLVYPLARQVMPNVVPLVTYVPRVEEMDFAFSPFPAEWRER